VGSEGRCKTGIAPTIVVQPADQAIFAGETATLTVVAYGSKPLAYQWPVSSTNFDLEMSNRLSAPTWIKVGVAPVQLGGQNIVSLGMTNAQQYFRLRHP
jgi:hypothetical protein